MRGSTPLSRRAETLLAQQAAQGLATQRDPLALDKLLAQMVIVEAGVGAACQPQDAFEHGIGQTAVAGPPTIGVCQSRLPVFAHTFFQALNLAHAQAQESGGSGTRQLSLHASGNHRHALQLFLAQCKCLLSHRVTFSCSP